MKNKGRDGATPSPLLGMFAVGAAPKKNFFSFQKCRGMQIILWSIFLVIVYNWIFGKKNR